MVIYELKIPGNYLLGIDNVYYYRLYFNQFPTKQEVLDILRNKHCDRKDRDKFYCDEYLALINKIINVLEWEQLEPVSNSVIIESVESDQFIFEVCCNLVEVYEVF